MPPDKRTGPDTTPDPFQSVASSSNRATVARVGDSGRQPATREQELRDAIEKADLPARDYRVYRALSARAEWKSVVIRDKFQPRSLAELAAWSRMSRANVARALNHLQRHGWLQRHRHFSDKGIGGRGHATRYQLEHGKDCDCLPAVSRAAPKESQPEPLSADKESQAELGKGLRTCHVTAGQAPGSAKSVRDEEEVVTRTDFRGAADEEQMRRIRESWKLWPPGSEGEWANMTEAEQRAAR
jgi:DNA-binding MarR family transcriptional regulator